VTAVRTASKTLKLIPWFLSDDLGTLRRIVGGEADAGAVSNLSIVAVTSSILVTAVRQGNGTLKLISWELGDTSRIKRLKDSEQSGHHAGPVSLIAMTTVRPLTSSGNPIVVTAVRNLDGILELIAWDVLNDGTIVHLGDSGTLAGKVSEIALVRSNARDEFDTDHRVVTAVRTAAGTLKVIAWKVLAHGFERLGSKEAGEATHIAIGTSGQPQTFLTSMRRGGTGDLLVIAFDVDRVGGVERSAEFGSISGGDVTESAFAPAGNRSISATRDRNALNLISFKVSPSAVLVGEGA
jgi:hypothetical protein